MLGGEAQSKSPKRDFFDKLRKDAAKTAASLLVGATVVSARRETKKGNVRRIRSICEFAARLYAVAGAAREDARFTPASMSRRFRGSADEQCAGPCGPGA